MCTGRKAFSAATWPSSVGPLKSEKLDRFGMETDMETPAKRKQKSTTWIHWSARIFSVVSLAVMLLFFVGEKFNPTGTRSAEWLPFLFFPFGVSVVMVLA